jgi:hypothetical protein
MTTRWGGAVGAGQELLGIGVFASLRAGPVSVAGVGEPAVPRPAVGVNDGFGDDELLHQLGEGVAPPTRVSSTSTSPLSGSRLGATIARRSFCKISQAVS